MEPVYKILTIIFCFFVVVKLIDIVRTNNLKKDYLKKQKDNIMKLYDHAVHLQNALYEHFDMLKDKAIEYEDLLSADKIGALYRSFEDLINSFNKQVDKDMYVEEHIEHIKMLLHRMETIRTSLKEAEEKMRDLREEHHGSREEHIEWQEKFEKNWNKCILKDSKYFRECKEMSELTSKYHQLVKLMHPDVGGNGDKFIELREDYVKCKKILEEEVHN